MSRLRNIIHLVAYGLRPILIVLALAILTASMPAHAQDSSQINPKHSVATLSLGSGANQLQIGLARVSGEVVFEFSDPGDPIVTLKIVGDAREADYASISFSSKFFSLTA